MKQLRQLIKENIKYIMNERLTSEIPSEKILILLQTDYPKFESLTPEDLLVEPYDYTLPNSWLVLIPSLKRGFVVDLDTYDIEDIGFRAADNMIYGEKDMFRDYADDE